jgi:hypothetical protein
MSAQETGGQAQALHPVGAAALGGQVLERLPHSSFMFQGAFTVRPDRSVRLSRSREARGNLSQHFPEQG